MPTININRRVFEKLVGKKLPTEKLKDRISYLGTDLEKVDNDSITVEIFPNRPDMLSVQGFARAFSSFIGVKTGLRKYKVENSKEKVIIDSSVKNIRPYTACAIVKGIKYDDEKIKEIIDIQEKLHITYGRHRKKAAIGIYPFEKIKTPIRYTAKNPKDIIFQPLEYPNKINAEEILKKHPTGREYAHLLEGYDKFPVFIDANNEVLSVPPIINSHKTGRITNNTKDVFIECSGFDFRVLQKCLNMIVVSLADMGGKIYSMELVYDNKKYKTPNLEPEEMKIDLRYINKWLGLNLNESETKKLLERMGFDYRNKKVLIPAYRTDILHEVDIAEDIAIAYGYENFHEEIPDVATIGEENKFEVFKNRIADLLIGFSLIEVCNFHLSNKEILNDHMNLNSKLIEVEKSTNINFDVLRSWITPGLLQNLGNNKHNEYPQNIFEIGKVFKKGNTETGVEEDTKLAVAVCHSKANFTETKQILDSLFENLGLDCSIENIEHKSFIPGRVGKIIVKGKDIAIIGEIHPSVLTNFGIETPVSVFELDLIKLFEVINNI